MPNRTITKEPGLIVTFYGPRQKIESLTNLLGTALGLVMQAFPDQEDLSDPDQEKYLRYFDPPAAYDTRVVQLALNGSGDAQSAWERLRGELEALNVHQTLQHLADEDALWGYTLIYHATLIDEAALDHQTRKALRQPARPLLSPPLNNPKPLAQSKLLDSHLWLLDIPTEGEGAEAATVYLALSPPAKAEALLKEVLYGPAATLLMPDLIAHKGYRQKRQYLGEPRQLYQKRINESQEIVGALLDLSQNIERLKASQSETNEQLEYLSSAYNKLLKGTQLLEDLRLSLAQQLENYDWWQEQLGRSELTIYHQKQMQIAHRDLDLLIGKGQSMQQAARTAIEMIQMRLEQIREENEQWFQTLLAAVGMALAVSQLVDPDAAQALLETNLAQLLLQWLNLLPWLTLSSDSRLVQLALQFLLTILITFIITWAYHQWRKKGA